MTPPNDAKAVLALALDRDIMVTLLRENHNDWLDHGRYTGADGRDQMVPEEHWILARLRQQTARADEWEASFELYHAAEMCGIKMWQEATGQERVWPDAGKLTAWLLSRLDDKAKEVAELRGAVQLGLLFVEASGNPDGHTASVLRAALADLGTARQSLGTASGPVEETASSHAPA